MFFHRDKTKNKSQENNELQSKNEVFYSWKNIQAMRHSEKIQSQKISSKFVIRLHLKTKLFFKRSRIFCQDHWHLLVRSAAQNHLRIQKCKADYKVGEVCNITFESYSHLKRYQQKVRLITYSSTSTILSVFVAMLIVQVFLPSLRSHGATFTWVQTSWSGGATGSSANHTNNQTGWNQYQQKDSNIAVVNAGADLQLSLPAVQSVADDSDAQFNGTQSGDGFYTDGTGKLYLKKPQTAPCTLPAQCASGICTGNVCM